MPDTYELHVQFPDKEECFHLYNCNAGYPCLQITTPSGDCNIATTTEFSNGSDVYAASLHTFKTSACVWDSCTSTYVQSDTYITPVCTNELKCVVLSLHDCSDFIYLCDIYCAIEDEEHPARIVGFRLNGEPGNAGANGARGCVYYYSSCSLPYWVCGGAGGKGGEAGSLWGIAVKPCDATNCVCFYAGGGGGGGGGAGSHYCKYDQCSWGPWCGGEGGYGYVNNIAMCKVLKELAACGMPITNDKLFVIGMFRDTVCSTGGAGGCGEKYLGSGNTYGGGGGGGGAYYGYFVCNLECRWITTEPGCAGYYYARNGCLTEACNVTCHYTCSFFMDSVKLAQAMVAMVKMVVAKMQKPYRHAQDSRIALRDVFQKTDTFHKQRALKYSIMEESIDAKVYTNLQQR